MRATELRYARNTHKTMHDGEPEHTQVPLRIVSAADALLIDEATRARLIDFRRQRTITFERDTRTYRPASLFSQVHDSVAGLASALHVMEVLRAGGVDLGEPWRAAAGYSLSVEETAEVPPIERIAHPDAVRWQIGGLEVARYRPSNTRLPAREASRWLAHALSLHPSTRAAIVAEGFVPASLEHRNHFPLMDVEESLTLESVAEIELDLTTLLDGYELAPPHDDVHVLALARHEQPAPAFRHLDAGRELLASGRRLEATLAAFAQGLITPNPAGVAELLRDIADGSHRWSAARRLLDVVNPNQLASPEAARKRLATLAKLRRKAREYAHVLDVFIGEVHYDLGETASAREHLGAALRRDPQLSAAWVSMGRVYIHSLDFNVTWDCWDQALAQCPKHQVVRDVHEWRDGLLEAHPDFF